MRKLNNTEQIGRAYAAWVAYNHKQKLDRVHIFNLKRWLRVVEALNGR